MTTQHEARNRFGAFLFGLTAFMLAGVALADPPSRVARLGYLDGPVSVSPAGEDDWVEARLNVPLVTGDRLWADAGARVELQLGTAVIRVGSATSVTLLNLDDRMAQFQVTQGTLTVRVRRLDANQAVEIDTPNLAYVISRPGRYRVSVDPDGGATEVYTREGQAEVYGEDASYAIAAGQAFRFAGSGLRDYEALAQPGVDAFERWALERDRGYDNSNSARYVSRDVIGYQDLDAYGTWRAVPGYGNVWMPTRVSSGWAPYRDGHWAWIDPWGWTWVDDAPWGFAVSHYGRWASIGGGWGWIPGPVAARAVYAPALVAFIGGKNFEIAATSGRVGAVGWFPLGPRDVYRPAYPVSRAYFTNVNVSNTVINNTTVVNVYNNRGATNVRYANQQVPGAVIAVPTTAFVQSQPVARASLRVPREAVAAPASSVAAVAPIAVSVRGAAPQGAKPPPKVLERNVVAYSAPPAAPAGFAAKEHVLTANQGKPVDPAALATLRPSTPVAAPKVEVVKPARNARPVASPPARSAQVAPPGKGEPRGQSQESKPMKQPPAQRPAQPPAQSAVQPPAQPPAQPAAQPPAQPAVQPPAHPAAQPPAQRRNQPPAQTPPAAQPQPSPQVPPPAQAPARPEPPNRAPPLVDQPARTPMVTPPSRHPVPDQSPPQEARGRAPAPVPPAPVPPAAVKTPPASTPAPAAAPPAPVQRAAPEAPVQRKAPEPRAAPPAPQPVARPPAPPQASAPPAANAPPRNEPRPADDKKNEKKPDKKGDDSGKADDEPKHK